MNDELTAKLQQAKFRIEQLSQQNSNLRSTKLAMEVELKQAQQTVVGLEKELKQLQICVQEGKGNKE